MTEFAKLNGRFEAWRPIHEQIQNFGIFPSQCWVNIGFLFQLPEPMKILKIDHSAFNPNDIELKAEFL